MVDIFMYLFLFLLFWGFLMSLEVTNTLPIPFPNFLLVWPFEYLLSPFWILISFFAIYGHIDEVMKHETDILNPFHDVLNAFSEGNIFLALFLISIRLNAYFWLLYGFGKAYYVRIQDEVGELSKGPKKRAVQETKLNKAKKYILYNFLVGSTIILFLNAKYSFVFN